MRKLKKQVRNYKKFRKVFSFWGVLKWYRYIHFCDTDKKSRHISFRLNNGKQLFARSNSSDLWLINSILIGRNKGDEWIGDYDGVLKEISQKFGPESEIIVLDGGANIGLFSMLALDTFPNAKVIAVEADETNYSILVKNLERYGSRAVCMHNGIWSKSCSLRVINSDADDWGKRVEESDVKSEDAISAITIEDIMERYDLNSIDVVKMDIEGSEYHVFKYGEMKWLNGCNIFIIETHDSFIEGTDSLVNSEMLSRGYAKKVFGENQVFTI